MGNLAKQAMNINGVWLDNELEGFKTLSVMGRELMESEITTYTVGNMDGNVFKSKRTPSRIITVEYLLRASNLEQLRKKFNQLNAFLAVEQSMLIFNDEADKFFVGTKEKVSRGIVGTNSYVGEIEFYCADPFKRSVNEINRSATLDNATSFGVDYKSNYKSYPIIKTMIKSDCGYIAFTNQHGKIIQIGNPEEEDTARADLSETLIMERFSTSSLSGWNRNSAVLVTNGNGAEHKQVADMMVDTVKQKLTPASYGAGAGWHGPSITRTIPADSKGHVGARNATLSWGLNFSAKGQELGLTQFLLTGKNGENIAAAAFYKHRAADNNGQCILFVNGRALGWERVVTTKDNIITGENYGSCSIAKFGEEIIFNLSGRISSFKAQEIKDVEISQVSIYMAAFGTWPTMNRNNVRDVKFVSHSVENYNDIPNKFAAGDEIVTDCEEKMVYLNGAKQPGLAAIGSNWEEFYLEPGINQINCMYSIWATKPEFELRYREVYL